MIPIRAVIFDLGNVLIRFDDVHFAKRFAARAGGRDLEELRHFFHRGPVTMEYSMGRMTSEQFYQAAVCDLGFLGSFEEFASIWNEIFTPIDDTLALAMSLKGKLPRIILSNTNALHAGYLKKTYPILHDFDGHIFSQEVGLLKPDVRIYEHAVRQYGLDPAHTVFIDDIEANVDGARKAGLQAFQCLNPAQVRQELTNLGVPFI